MNTYDDNTKGNKSQSVADSLTTQKNKAESGPAFAGNQQVTVIQNKVQAPADNSPHAKRIAQMQAMADGRQMIPEKKNRTADPNSPNGLNTNTNFIVQRKKLNDPVESDPVQLQSSQVIQREVLQNAVVSNKVYKSVPHNHVVYYMIVDPSVDSALQIQIEKAKAFASVGANKHERLGLLFQYVDSLPKSEEGRNQIYEATGGTDDAGNTIREAYLGDCLSVASACRELSAFLQLLLAEEGIQTDYKVGTEGGVFNAQRHAWLQIPGDNDHVIDPTMTRVGLKPNSYSAGDTVAISAPRAASAIDFDAVQEAAYKTQVRDWWDKLTGKPKTLREKANEKAAEYDQLRAALIARIREMIRGSRVLTNLETEGIFSMDAIARRSMDELQNEIIPQLRAMSAWPENPGAAL